MPDSRELAENHHDLTFPATEKQNYDNFSQIAVDSIHLITMTGCTGLNVLSLLTQPDRPDGVVTTIHTSTHHLTTNPRHPSSATPLMSSLGNSQISDRKKPPT